jgi:hypothetical protein
MIMSKTQGLWTQRNLMTASVGAATLGASLVVLGGRAISAQDKYTLMIPNGLAWSDFRGYENWQDVAVSQTETSLKVIAANDAMMNAYRDGVPGNGKPFPDGSKITKIEWSFKKNPVAQYFVNVPDTLKTVGFMEKDSRRFPGTHEWAYAQWAYDAASDTFKPSELDPSGAECGNVCHTAVSAQDYVFTAYPKR